jgi:hypothetical protein
MELGGLLNGLKGLLPADPGTVTAAAAGAAAVGSGEPAPAGPPPPTAEALPSPVTDQSEAVTDHPGAE